MISTSTHLGKIFQKNMNFPKNKNSTKLIIKIISAQLVMNIHCVRKIILCVLFSVLLMTDLYVERGYAQSLIVGIPNAEVVHKNHYLLAHESQINWWNQQDEAGNRQTKWNSFSFACYGIGNNTELNVTLFNLGLPASGNRTLGLGAKSIYPLPDILPGWEITGIYGAMLPISLNGQGVGIWGYGGLSARLPLLHTRLTAIPTFGTRQIFGRDTWSVMVGYEQPITEKLSLVGDWYSGTHDIAAFICAVQYDIDRHWTVIGGYKIPNNAVSGHHTLMMEITLEF